MESKENKNIKEVKKETEQNQEKEEKIDKKTAKNKKREKTNKYEQEIEQLKQQFQEINDKYLRLSAEFDNYRKRTLKEKTEILQTAGSSLLESLLPIIDDFERALKTVGESKSLEALKEGIDLIYNKFLEFIKSKGISEIEALNTEFDTDFHEAITKIPTPEENMKGKVVDVIQKGYKMNDKVIRFSKVVIGE